ncbi:hypothetical protein ACLOJK_000069 [Asimina triloba]
MIDMRLRTHQGQIEGRELIAKVEGKRRTGDLVILKKGVEDLAPGGGVIKGKKGLAFHSMNVVPW